MKYDAEAEGGDGEWWAVVAASGPGTSNEGLARRHARAVVGAIAALKAEERARARVSSVSSHFLGSRLGKVLQARWLRRVEQTRVAVAELLRAEKAVRRG